MECSLADLIAKMAQMKRNQSVYVTAPHTQFNLNTMPKKSCGPDAKKIKCKSPSSTSRRQILLFRGTNTLWALGFLWNFHNESNETNHNNKHHDMSMHFDFQCYILCTVMKTSPLATRREAKHSHESRMFHGEFPLSNWHYKNERTVSRYII